MNQQQLQTEENISPVSASSFSTLPPSGLEQTTVTDAETPLEGEQTAQEIGIADSYLLPLLQAEARFRKRDTRNMFIILSVYTAGMAWVMNYAMRDGGQVSFHLLRFYALMCLLLFIVIASLARRSYRRKHALAAELAKPQATDSIGVLIEATRVENTQVRSLSKRALIELLPQLRASDSDLLTDARRERLLRLLTISPNDTGYRDLTELFSRSAYRREVDVRVAILKAYQQVGGPKELQQVERLAKGNINWQSASKVPAEIKLAANECLPFVQSRAGEQRASEQLLRASSGDAVPADMLLRPSDERPDNAPEQLLRGSERRITIHGNGQK